MSYCILCGYENQRSTKFCISCGNQLIAPKPGSANPLQPSGHSGYSVAQRHTIPAGTSARQPHTGSGKTSWLSANRKYVLLGAGSLCLIWCINYLFFKPDPGKDGQSVAEAECRCEQEKVKESIAEKKALLLNFNEYAFTSVTEARQKLDSVENHSQEVYGKCLQQTRQLQENTMKKYSMNDQAANMYSEQYFKQKQLCTVNQDGELEKVTAELTARISLLAMNAAPKQQLYQNSTDIRTGINSDEPVSKPSPDTSEGILTDDDIKTRITNLFEAENSIGSSGDIEKIMSLYEFPMLRYYGEKNVNQATLFNIYYNSYYQSLLYHKVDGFEDKFTITRPADGSIKVIVGCRFEFSTRQSPNDRRSRNVYNVYVIEKTGKIKSVYQLM